MPLTHLPLPAVIARVYQAAVARYRHIVQYFIRRSAQVSLLLIVPFVLMLLAIALLPLVVPYWWASNRNKALVVLTLGVPIAGYILLQGEAGWRSVQHTLLEYAEFMVLMGSPHTISGGIALRGDSRLPHGECLFPWSWGRLGEYHGHNWRLDAAHPPIAPDQR